jgi:hypothetical protein
VIKIENNVIDKSNFKPFYESNSQNIDATDEKSYQKFHDFLNKIVSFLAYSVCVIFNFKTYL